MEGIGGVLALRVEYGHRWRHLIVGHMMVADNEVDAKTLGIGNLLVGLDAAVEDNH